ncbi:MAG: hypothetical protein JWO06_1371 [Bacteroidota bacterium]|nr:hypothetical protein [Bacteroidota bacterium]
MAKMREHQQGWENTISAGIYYYHVKLNTGQVITGKLVKM